MRHLFYPITSHILYQVSFAFLVLSNAHAWVKPTEPIPKDSLVIRTDIFINAPPLAVWKLIKSIERYEELSKGLIQAKADEVSEGMRVDFWINLGKPFGVTHSKEQFGVIDEEVLAISWIRSLGFGKQSERWQLVEPEMENGSHYYTGLKIPGVVGKLVAMLKMDKQILRAFQVFAKGLKREAEVNGVSNLSVLGPNSADIVHDAIFQSPGSRSVAR